MIHIPIQDTDELSPYDRQVILETLKEIKDKENTNIENAKNT